MNRFIQKALCAVAACALAPVSYTHLGIGASLLTGAAVYKQHFHLNIPLFLLQFCYFNATMRLF